MADFRWASDHKLLNLSHFTGYYQYFYVYPTAIPCLYISGNPDYNEGIYLYYSTTNYNLHFGCESGNAHQSGVYKTQLRTVNHP